MAPEDGKLRTGEDQDQAFEERRQSRLWLGYSADNLRTRENVERGRRQSESEELDHNATALLSNRTIRNDHYESSADIHCDNSNLERPQTRVQKKLTSDTPFTKNEEDDDDEPFLRPSRPTRHYTGPQACNLPADYENLDEITAPSPVKHFGEDREQDCLEDRDNKPSGDEDVIPGDCENLNEVGDPIPVGDTKKGDTKGYLEDREPGELARAGYSHENQSATKHFATEVYIISYLVLFSLLGTLARLGLQALTFYPGAPVQTGIVWCNVGGSLILGFLSEDRKIIREKRGIETKENDKQNDKEQSKSHRRCECTNKRHAAVKKTLPLYIGLATGFCGSFTSFSSFMRDAFFALSNALAVPINHPSSTPISPTVNVPRNPGYSFFAVLAVLLITIGLSLMAIQFGAHLALFLDPFIPSIQYLFPRKIIDCLVAFLAFGCWLAAVFMAIWPPDRPGGPVGNASWAEETWRSQALFALVFAPPGCVLRFYVSLHLNGRIKAFPLGTFAVNIFGTIMEAVFLDLQRVPVGGMVGCQVLQGMSDGFCGCLTTVSTWVAELTALRIKHAYFYGTMSVSIALSFLVIIIGSLQWTKGFAHPLCTT